MAPCDDGESDTQEPQSPGKRVKKKLRRSRGGCRKCKLARKKCSEERPRCKRCSARDWVCEYSVRRVSYSEEPGVRSAGVSPSTDPYLTSNLPNIASILNPPPPLGGSGSGTGAGASSYSDPLAASWVTNGTLELADFAGSLDFIESAFPRINHLSPSSATSTDRPAVYESLQTGYGTGAGAISTYAAMGLWEHERVYLKTFEEDFWSIIVRKEQYPSLSHLHFSQLATFEPLKFAILAVGAGFRAQMLEAETETQRQAMIDESIRFHSKAVRGLKVSIGNQPRSLWNAIVACTFCLFFYELIRGDVTTTPAQHLLGALHLMKIDKNAGLNRTSTFHQKIFRYYDVIAALSLGRRPLTGSLTYPEQESKLRMGDNTESRSRSIAQGNFGNGGVNEHSKPHQEAAAQSTDPYGCVDNVFGLAATFWPLLHRLAQLTQRTTEGSVPVSQHHNHTNSNNQSSPSTSPSGGLPRRPSQSQIPTLAQKHQRISLAALELSILEWQPHLELHAVNMEHYEPSDSALQSLLQNAEAYRHAALIHLYRHHGEHYHSPRIQHAVASTLQCCLRVMVFGRPYGGLLWPLFTAGACATQGNHRHVAGTVLDQLAEVQGLGNVSKAKGLLVEVWREMDVENSRSGSESSSIGVRWQDVAEKLGWSVVLA